MSPIVLVAEVVDHLDTLQDVKIISIRWGINMSTIEIFGKQIEIRDKDCSVWGTTPDKFGYGNTVNLFIQLNSRCNANCDFCEYHTVNEHEFDFDKLEYVIQKINKKVTIGKINITGGEPTLDTQRFNRLLSIISKYKFNGHNIPYITLNTNGYRLDVALEWDDTIDSYAISRHHYDDQLNREIFRSSYVADTSVIKRAIDTVGDRGVHKIHLRCNLIKRYIDSIEEIHNYLEYCAGLGVIWVGFVTLMPLNRYCVENTVLADKLINSNKFYISEKWERIEGGKLECQCNDYLYPTKSGKIIRFYNRIFCNPGLNAGQLVYTGKELTLGFSGEIII